MAPDSAFVVRCPVFPRNESRHLAGCSRQPRMAFTQREKEQNMTRFRGDEKLLFVPNSSPRSAKNRDLLRVVYAYPNVYTVGICSLGYQVVWAAISRTPGVHVSRMFTDASEVLPDQIDVLGLSISWELDYPGMFETLDYLNVPRRARDRAPTDPIVFGGGPVLTSNPEPFADFFDVVLIGDGEELVEDFLRVWQELSDEEADRNRKLLELARRVDGVYVPALYDVTYDSPTGPVASIQPVDSRVPPVVHKRTYRGKVLASSTVVTKWSAWENIHMVEAVRSCPEMCRFCLASYSTLPFRPASLDHGLIESIDAGLKHTKRIGILGASVTQHPQFEELIDRLSGPDYDDVRISLSSVRTNTVTEKLAKFLSTHDSRSVTVAVESGSERLREIINKKLSNDEIESAVGRANSGGLSGMKLYGMAGLPGETDDDIEDTVKMLKTLKASQKGRGHFRLTYGCSTFVPKAHTPFQWFPVRKDAEKKLKRLDKATGSLGVEFRPESYKWSVIQALISRGDRRISRVLETAAEFGDSGGSIKRAMKALKKEVPPLEYYVFEEWSPGTTLPWSVIQMTLSNEMVEAHRQQATALFN